MRKCDSRSQKRAVYIVVKQGIVVLWFCVINKVIVPAGAKFHPHAAYWSKLWCMNN